MPSQSMSSASRAIAGPRVLGCHIYHTQNVDKRDRVPIWGDCWGLISVVGHPVAALAAVPAAFVVFDGLLGSRARLLLGGGLWRDGDGTVAWCI